MSSLFSFYYDTLIELQNKYPKNLLIKHLKSSLWGQLSKYNKVSGPEEKFYNKVYTSDFNDDDTDYYIKAINKVYNSDEDFLTLIPQNKIYKYNFRFKPFLISYCRSYFENKIIYPNLDKCFRIMTDGAVFTEEIDVSNIIGFIPEEKTTGLIQWTNVMSYKKV